MEEQTNKETHEQVDSTHYSKTPIEQHHDTGRASTNRQEKINTSHESTGLRKQNAKDRMELADEDMEGITSSRTNKDDIQKTADEKHNRTMRLENHISGRNEEDAYTIIIENANEQEAQLTTTGKSHISPIRLKKLKLDTNEEQRIEQTHNRTRNTARQKVMVIKRNNHVNP
jgi:hypothetical protein